MSFKLLTTKQIIQTLLISHYRSRLLNLFLLLRLNHLFSLYDIPCPFILTRTWNTNYGNLRHCYDQVSSGLWSLRCTLIRIHCIRKYNLQYLTKNIFKYSARGSQEWLTFPFIMHLIYPGWTSQSTREVSRYLIHYDNTMSSHTYKFH